MTHPNETRKLLRTGRLQNARNFSLKDPLNLLVEAAAIGLDVNHALHCAGGSLKHARPVAVFASRDLELIRETAEAMAEQQARDYDEGVARTLAATSKAYSGD